MAPQIGLKSQYTMALHHRSPALKALVPDLREKEETMTSGNVPNKNRRRDVAQIEWRSVHFVGMEY